MGLSCAVVFDPQGPEAVTLQGRRTSSDIKECWTEKFLHQELDYMHSNPVSGKWTLVDDPMKYPYSSAAFYELGTEPLVPLLHLDEL